MTPQDIHNLTLETAKSVNRARKLNEMLDEEYCDHPEFPSRVIQALRLAHPRKWKKFTRLEKQQVIRACEGKDDAKTIKVAYRSVKQPFGQRSK